MKRYTVFFKSSGSEITQAVLVSDEGQFFLGGTRCKWILTKTKVEAEKIARDVRKQKSPYFSDGDVFVEQAKLQPW